MRHQSTHTANKRACVNIMEEEEGGRHRANHTAKERSRVASLVDEQRENN